MLGRNWAKNLMGFSVGEGQMQAIPHPYTELYVHVTTKTVQTGTLLGCFAIAPILAGVKGQFNQDGMKKWMETCGKYGVFVGLIAGPLMTAQRLSSVQASDDAVWDRSFRLRYNQGQCRVDRLCLVGAIGGCAAAKYLGDSGTLGALVGIDPYCN